MYGMSASQGNSDAYLRVGDFHYYGKAGIPQDKYTASQYYQIAADMKNSHAIFDLGVMYEIGDGVIQDFHLAKRFFDNAAEFDPEAKVPRNIALLIQQVINKSIIICIFLLFLF